MENHQNFQKNHGKLQKSTQKFIEHHQKLPKDTQKPPKLPKATENHQKLPTKHRHELIIRAKCHPHFVRTKFHSRSHLKSGLSKNCQGIPSQGRMPPNQRDTIG